MIQAAANVAWALCRGGHAAELSFAVPECNSLGLGLVGGGTLHDAFQAVEQGAADVVIVLENDLYRHVLARCLLHERLVEIERACGVVGRAHVEQTGKVSEEVSHDSLLKRRSPARGPGVLEFR